MKTRNKAIVITPDEKRILRQEIPKYIKENCYYTDGSIIEKMRVEM